MDSTIGVRSRPFFPSKASTKRICAYYLFFFLTLNSLNGLFPSLFMISCFGWHRLLHMHTTRSPDKLRTDYTLWDGLQKCSESILRRYTDIVLWHKASFPDFSF